MILYASLKQHTREILCIMKLAIQLNSCCNRCTHLREQTSEQEISVTCMCVSIYFGGVIVKSGGGIIIIIIRGGGGGGGGGDGDGDGGGWGGDNGGGSFIYDSTLSFCILQYICKSVSTQGPALFISPYSLSECHIHRSSVGKKCFFFF
jgi:hypothetical protein